MFLMLFSVWLMNSHGGISERSFVPGEDVFLYAYSSNKGLLNLYGTSGDNSGGILENRLFRMAVGFGVTEGITLLKHRCLDYNTHIEGGDSQAMDVIWVVSTDVLVSFLSPGIMANILRDRKPGWKHGFSFLGACVGEGLGALMYFKILYPNPSKRPGYLIELTLINLPSVVLSIIALNF